MTYSIVARDPATGQFGVACATGGPVVGSLVPHVRSGVGAIATQSSTNPFLGMDGLKMLQAGGATDAVLDDLIGMDAGREKRQCIMIGVAGRPATWTGNLAEAAADHIAGADFAVAGNMLATRDVLVKMASAFEAGTGQSLADRLLLALAAAEDAGGDKRGTKSAALKVCAGFEYPSTDIRADWSDTAISDLRDILAATRRPDYAEFFDQLPRRSDGNDQLS